MALMLTRVATKIPKRSSGGMATSEQTEVLKKENDRLRSLDSGLNEWSERQSFCGGPKITSYFF